MPHVPGASPAPRVFTCTAADYDFILFRHETADLVRPVEPCQESVHVRRRSGVALLADAGHRATGARLLLERRRQQTPQTREVLSQPIQRCLTASQWRWGGEGGLSHRDDLVMRNNQQAAWHGNDMQILPFIFIYLFLCICCCAACGIFRAHALERIMPGPSRMRQSSEFLSAAQRFLLYMTSYPTL